MKGYYFITDRRLSRRGNTNDTKAAIRAGSRVVQYREKDASTREMCEEAVMLRALCKGALFIVNDRIDVALASGADGVHIGQEDMPYATARRLLGANSVIGITVHDLKEALDAEEEGADYVGVSPIFSTGTKQDAGSPAGIEMLRVIKSQLRIPVVAIGGINKENAADVIFCGADAICAISAVVASDDPENEILFFKELFNDPDRKRA